MKRRARLEAALLAARTKLAATRPEDYSSQRYYRAVRTRRERLVRQLERLLDIMEEARNAPSVVYRRSLAVG